MAGIWRAVAACSHWTADIQCVASLQQLARYSSQLLHSVQQTQQCRFATSSTAVAAEANAAAATSSSATPSHALAVQNEVQQQTGGQAVLSTLILQETSAQLGPAHKGLYYNFDKSKVPEAFQPFHQAFYSSRPGKLQRKAGCRGLQAEFSSTNSSSLMWRRSTQELMQVLDSGGGGQHISVKGPMGSGKSIAVVQLIEWARSNGWLALYVPSAVDLTRGGFFYKRSDGSYDTILSAQLILKSVSDNHDKQLATLKLQLQDSKDLLQSASSVPKGPKDSLGDLVSTGLSTDDNGQLAVDCCLQLINELSAASTDTPVLLAVDDYNALYWQTEYGTTVHKAPRGKPAYQYRKEVKVNKLNLARNFKLLERTDLGECRVLVANSCSRMIPDDVGVTPPHCATYHMPRFSEVETAHALYYYHERGLVPAPPTQQQVTAMKAVTNGSGQDLRKWCVSVTQTDMGLL